MACNMISMVVTNTNLHFPEFLELLDVKAGAGQVDNKHVELVVVGRVHVLGRHTVYCKQ